mmetsp:Transcript_25387/g.74728  ORF Transcript_25387/g.74728 Transcript_25387/m.74728 type:complete len:118 (-) Transcript_25387:50-403(-)
MQEERIELGVLVNRDGTLQKLTEKMWGKGLGLLCIEDGVIVDQIFVCWDWSGKNPFDCPPASQCKDEVLFRVYSPADVPESQKRSDADDDSSAATVVIDVLLTMAIILSAFLPVQHC